MRKIIKILHTKEWIDAKEKKHLKTYALIDDGGEASGYGRFKVGDSVEVFYHKEYDQIKMRHGAKRNAVQNNQREKPTD